MLRSYNDMYNIFSFVRDKCPFCLKRYHGHIFLKGTYAVTAVEQAAYVLPIFQARLFKQKTQVISFNSVANFEASLV